MLAGYISLHQHDWDRLVGLVPYAYNTSVHSAEGNSPYEMVFGRLARTPLELDLGLPLKYPCSDHEKSASIRSNLQSVAEVVRKNLGCRRNIYSKSDSLQYDSWVPLAPSQSVCLRRSKNWKFGGRWIGTYQIISHRGVNYKLRSKAGKDLVVHHNQAKACTISFNKGEPYCPVQEAEEIEMVSIPRRKCQKSKMST